MTAHSTGWLNFEKVREGREPGVREGYSPRDFVTMKSARVLGDHGDRRRFV